MKRLWRLLGISAFWLTWPSLFLRMRRTARVRVAIVHDGKVLMVKNWYNSGQWQLPGGGIKTDESPLEAAKREVKEEINLSLPENTLHEIGEIHTVRERGIPFACHTFSAVVTDVSALKPRAIEIVDYCWRPISDAAQHGISTSTREALGLIENRV